MPLQRAVRAALEAEQVDAELASLRAHFATKRTLTLRRLTDMGVRIEAPPRGSFYAWGSLEDLPAPFDSAQTFFRRALQRRVLTVPGPHFDVDPGARQRGDSAHGGWMRFSFGPPMDSLRMGLDRLTRMVRGDD
jgi:aspartate/methionine/tyrosine aminotransferase